MNEYLFQLALKRAGQVQRIGAPDNVPRRCDSVVSYGTHLYNVLGIRSPNRVSNSRNMASNGGTSRIN